VGDSGLGEVDCGGWAPQGLVVQGLRYVIIVINSVGLRLLLLAVEPI
jgi:hypothetical protein